MGVGMGLGTFFGAKAAGSTLPVPRGRAPCERGAVSCCPCLRSPGAEVVCAYVRPGPCKYISTRGARAELVRVVPILLPARRTFYHLKMF